MEAFIMTLNSKNIYSCWY